MRGAPRDNLTPRPPLPCGRGGGRKDATGARVAFDERQWFETTISVSGARTPSCPPLAAFGEQRERFPTADALQRYAGLAPVTPSSSGPAGPFPGVSGRRPTVTARGPAKPLTTPPSALSPSSGSACCSAAGWIVFPTMNLSASPHSRSEGRRCSSPPPRRLADFHSSPPQGVSWAALSENWPTVDTTPARSWSCFTHRRSERGSSPPAALSRRIRCGSGRRPREAAPGVSER